MAILRADKNAKDFQKILGRGGFIFYKPESDDKDSIRRWNAFSYEQNVNLVKAIASEILPKFFEEYGLKVDDYQIDVIVHYELDEKIPTIKLRFFKSIYYEEMRKVLLDVSRVLGSNGGIEIFDTYK